MKRYPSCVIIRVLEMLLELRQIDTIVFWAWTCKTIFETCTKECEARLLRLNPNDTHLFFYKDCIWKWYHYKKSPIPLRWIVSSLLRCPVERKIQCVNLPSNITLQRPKRRTLWLYKTSIEELVLQTSDNEINEINEIHTLTLCNHPDPVDLAYILGIFPSLVKLKLISARLCRSGFNWNLSSPSNLVTLSIIECDITKSDLNDYMLCFKKLEKLKFIRTTLIRSLLTRLPTFNFVTLSIIECDITKFEVSNWILWFKGLQKLELVNNTWNHDMVSLVNLTPSIKSVFITHTKPKALIINTTDCGKEVFFK
jgi:hypothetical protein